MVKTKKKLEQRRLCNHDQSWSTSKGANNKITLCC